MEISIPGVQWHCPPGSDRSCASWKAPRERLPCGAGWRKPWMPCQGRNKDEDDRCCFIMFHPIIGQFRSIPKVRNKTSSNWTFCIFFRKKEIAKLHQLYGLAIGFPSQQQGQVLGWARRDRSGACVENPRHPADTRPWRMLPTAANLQLRCALGPRSLQLRHLISWI